jgi:cell division protein FtsQ
MWHDIRSLNATASGLMAVTVVASIAAGVWWISQRPMFTLKAVRVESIYDMDLKHVSEITVRNSIAGKITGNFFTANLEQVRTTFEAVPWVRRATVRREWPNQLIVDVEEHEPLGTWGEDGRLLSVKGEVFTANLAEADEDHALPGFDGPEGSEKEVLARFAQLRTWFGPVKLVPETLSLSNRYAWTVGLDNGMMVALGREQNKNTMRERVNRLVAVYPQLVARLKDGSIDTIDMRYPNGLALASKALNVPTDATKPVQAAGKKKPQSGSKNISKTNKHI